MENVQMFNFNGSQVRTLTIDGDPYFVGIDVAEILGYVKPANAIKDHVPSSFKGVTEIMTPGGK